MSESIYITLKEVCGILRRSRAQVDRYRRNEPDFPKPLVLSETRPGTLLFLKAEIFEWIANRTRRTLRPEAASA